MVTDLIDMGRWKAGARDILIFFDAGYDAPRMAYLLDGLAVEVLGRMRTDRVMRKPVPVPWLSPPQGGRPPEHGKEFRFAKPDTWGEPHAATVQATDRYGTARVMAWDRVHPRLTTRSAWIDHTGELPVIEGTLIRLEVHHLPGGHDPLPVWLWSSAAETVVVVVGNDPHINGKETTDRAGLRLPPQQDRLLREVVAAHADTVLVVMSSYPYALDWADEHVPAMLWISHAGQETGRALARVLRGEADPAGRLPQTWYRGDDELPGRLDYDIIKAGWTYQYHQAAPLYAFGHGLSYTRFEYTQLALDQKGLGQDGEIRVRVSLRNAGPRAGTETVQLYARALDARYQAPRLKLVGFRKARLAAGRLAVEVSRTGEGAAAVLELRAGRRRLATVEVPVTGDRYAWATVAVPLAEQLEGVHDLRIVLTGEQRLRTLTFTP